MEQIRISKIGSQNGWQASIGQVALDMLSRKKIDGEIRTKILDQSVDILESCGNPKNDNNDDTGLVIGYVQSGKTLSFTTVSALAAQNGFNVIIVIAGTTKPLVNQTYKRLYEDLDILNTTDVSWKPYKNPTPSDRQEVIVDLQEGILNPNPVLLITVMKNKDHLKKLIRLFSTGIDSKDCRALIIDDEADQASLNTQAKAKNEYEASTIYSLIRDLKKTFVNHTYIQYTATPQAPLFISILDVLSPSFVKILVPGDDYTGGKAFFERNKASHYPHVYDIPKEEIYTKDRTFNTIPQTLVEATTFYFISVVIGALNGERAPKNNRTMMVHPSQLKLIHSIYERWLIILKKRWLQELSLADSDPDKKLLVDSFRAIYDSIKSDTIRIPEFDEVMRYLPEIIKVTPIFLSNSSVNNKIDFKKHYSMILVGGQVLDRGFTVEGLNVTYMPRSIGVGNADTIQQRCRFFGYKRKYLDLCRIYLPRTSKRAYIDYVMHEEDLRNKLDKLDKDSKPLKEFKRMFILSKDLNITRKNVISDDVNRYRLSGWRYLQFIDLNFNLNNQLIEEFRSNVSWEDLSAGPNASDIQKHRASIIKASTLIDDLLLSLQYKDASNSLLINHFLSLLSILLDNNADLEVYIVDMSRGHERDRSITDQGKLKSVLQGANENTDYRGDRAYISDSLITVQLHNFKIKNQDFNFNTLAIHFPDNYAQNIIVLEN